MPAERSVPPAPATRSSLTPWILAGAVMAAISTAYIAGRHAGSTHEVMSAVPAASQRVAFVREGPCASGRCQTLWLGPTRDGASAIAALSAGDRCEGIAWASDGFRVGFVVNGYQLRIFDGHTGEARGQVNLLEPEGTPSSRIARGVTFSPNGAAVTFDDCPRQSSGCRSGLAAIR